jgi:Flp pilus assembly pilin Flp
MGVIMACLDRLKLSLRDARGQSLVEYSLILTGVALAVIAVIVVVGKDTVQLYNNASLLKSLK